MQETSDEIAFTEEYINETTTHRYRAVRMWEQDSMIFLNNPALLPLAPLAQTTSPQILWEQVRENIARISDKETRQNTAAYTNILAGLKFEKDFIRQFLSEDVMQDSVTYQDILQKGNKQGEERLIFILINQRFGEIDSPLIQRIKVLGVEQLENLASRLLDFSDVSELAHWLNQQETT